MLAQKKIMIVLGSIISLIQAEKENYDFNGVKFLCQEEDSCSNSITLRNCQCDQDCIKYGDCCYDAKIFNTSLDTTNLQMKCIGYGDDEPNLGAQMISTCAEAYRGPDEVKLGCQNKHNISDPLMQAPVTDPFTGLTYQNRYCAECNDATSNYILTWLVALKCSSLRLTKNVNTRFIWNNLSYNKSMNRWGVNFATEFHPCNVTFDIPSYLSSSVRRCYPNVVSFCPSNSNNSTENLACKLFSAMVYGRDDLAFKNQYCAFCNGLDANEIACNFESTERKKGFSFALLLDVNQSDGDQVGVSIPGYISCGSNQKYDPYFKKCRNLVCALPDYKRVNGKCRKNA